MSAPLKKLLQERPTSAPTAGLWTKTKIVSLQNSIDCFVSPHRSEGFGYKPGGGDVSGQAGDRDALFVESGFHAGRQQLSDRLQADPDSVDGGARMWRGHVWADPSVDHLSHLMRTVFEDREGRETSGAAGWRGHSQGVQRWGGGAPRIASRFGGDWTGQSASRGQARRPVPPTLNCSPPKRPPPSPMKSGNWALKPVIRRDHAGLQHRGTVFLFLSALHRVCARAILSVLGNCACATTPSTSPDTFRGIGELPWNRSAHQDCRSRAEPGHRRCIQPRSGNFDRRLRGHARQRR